MDLINLSKGNLAKVKKLIIFWYFIISRSATVPGLKRCPFLIATLIGVFFFFLVFFVIRQECTYGTTPPPRKEILSLLNNSFSSRS